MRQSTEKQSTEKQSRDNRIAGNPAQARRQGFTLVELLVVIMIIGILSGLVVPSVMRGLGQANKTKDQNNLKEIHRACLLYSGDHQSKFPYAKGKSQPAFRHYQVLANSQRADFEPKILISPASNDEVAELNDDGRTWNIEAANNSYTYADHRISSDSAKELLASNDCQKDQEGSTEGYEDGVLVVFSGGSAEFLPFNHDLLGGESADWIFPKGLVDNNGNDGKRR